MLSWRLLSVLLALLVLSATVAPLSAGLASGRGEELFIERLVVLDPSGRVKKVKSLGWRVPLARQPSCPSCVRPGLEVLMERLVVLVNESRTSGRVAERLTAVRLERVIRDPSRPCSIYVGLDVAAYARETPTYKASVVLLNYRSPRGGYVGSVAFVKVFPLDRDPVPRGEVVYRVFDCDLSGCGILLQQRMPSLGEHMRVPHNYISSELQPLRDERA